MDLTRSQRLSRRAMVGGSASLAMTGLTLGSTSAAAWQDVLEATPDTMTNDVLTSLQTSRAWINHGAAAPFDFQNGKHPATEDQLRNEMNFLYEFGYRGIVTNAMTYGLEATPRIAKDVGFEHVIVKLWWPDEQTFEVEKANLAREIDAVDAIVVGNETVNKAVHRGESSDQAVKRLHEEIEGIQAEYGLPVSTGLHFRDWQMHPEISTSFGDFTFFNAQPWWVLHRTNPVSAAEWAVEAYQLILATPDMPEDRAVVLQEAAFPSGAIDPSSAPGATRENQKVFYTHLIASGIPFVYGFSCDQEYAQAWSPPGGFGGLWDSNYHPKPVVDIIDLGVYANQEG